MRDLFFSITFHPGKLTAELIAALGHVSTGGKIHGVSSNPSNPCIVHVEDNTSPAQESTIAGIVAAHNPAPPPTPIRAWAEFHRDNLLALVRAAKALDDGINGHTVAGANDTTRLNAIRPAIVNAIDLLNDVPQIDTHFQKLGDIMGFPAPGSATLAQCRNMLVALQALIGEHLAVAVFAATIEE